MAARLLREHFHQVYPTEVGFNLTVRDMNACNTKCRIRRLLPSSFQFEEVARRLHADVSWVREKIRRRYSNPIPVYNLGWNLLFDWMQVVDWVRSSPRPVHVMHTPR